MSQYTSLSPDSTKDSVDLEWDAWSPVKESEPTKCETEETSTVVKDEWQDF